VSREIEKPFSCREGFFMGDVLFTLNGRGYSYQQLFLTYYKINTMSIVETGRGD
jgi:hypothetical protein